MNKCAPKSIREWRAKEDKISQSVVKKKKRTLHKGRVSKIADVEKEFYEWIIAKRSKEKIITVQILIDKLKLLKPALANNTECSLRFIIARFMKRNLLVFRQITHVGQELPENFQNKIQEFRLNLDNIRNTKNVSENTLKLIIFCRVYNVDETPIYKNFISMKT